MEKKQQDLCVRPRDISGNPLILVCQGAIVGTGAILPGVSGGVLCAAFGIYEPLMAFLAHPVQSFRKYACTLIPFLIGWVTGFVLLARLVEYLFASFSEVALMLFAGLIFGTVPGLMEKGDREKTPWVPFTLAIACFYLLFRVLAGGTTLSVTPNGIWYVFCGLVWGLSTVIPGLSSSSVLICMGIYEPMTEGIANLDFAVLIPLLLGTAITLFVTARFVNRLFENHFCWAVRVVTGIMIASTLMILPDHFSTFFQAVLSFMSFAVGFALARAMDIAKEKNEDSMKNKKGEEIDVEV